MMGCYVLLEEIALADCALEVIGHDLSDLFATVSRAVAEIMVDPHTIPVTIRREIALTASALDLLLFDWIAELIFVKDSESLIFTETVVTVTGPPACQLTAQVAGGPIDRARTILRADVKAPTFHRFALERDARGWCARIVLDV
jgi:protein archease